VTTDKCDNQAAKEGDQPPTENDDDGEIDGDKSC